MNETRKYVASRTLEEVDWKNSQLLQGDVADDVARLKGEHDQIHMSGCGTLMQTLLQHHLIDRFNLWVYPLVLGSGKRLFGPLRPSPRRG